MADKKEVEERREATRLKSMAKQKYESSNLKQALKYAKRAHRHCPTLDGISEMLTAFKILRTADKFKLSSARCDALSSQSPPDWYKILGVEPFSHINSIKKQYKQLALMLHPDKNSLEASDEAFRLVIDAFQVLSDKIKRKEYDMKLRIAMQSASEVGEIEPLAESVETFWTACSRCRLFHQFQRRYVGHDLLCPNCKKSFTAVEVSAEEEAEKDKEESACVRRSDRIRVNSEILGEKSRNSDSKMRISGADEVLERDKSRKAEMQKKNVEETQKIVEETSTAINKEPIVYRRRSKNHDRKCESVKKVRVKRGKADEELTLAELQLQAKKRMKENKKTVKFKQDEGAENAIRKLPKTEDMGVMVVEDSDFYDFDNDRVEKGFKKGQVWAIYDDDDGMPRHYGLIDEVVSVNPFQVKISWLDLQINGDDRLICWEKMGFHVSCGRFKITRNDTINLLNVFSHMVDCERAAKEAYRIYPKKGSVWALYNQKALDMEEMNSLATCKRHCYDIVVFLTSYSEMHGLSMAFLVKVDGFRSVFRRREIGSHAISWLEKDDIRLCSHQIPARKLSGCDAPDRLNDCWELDPASLPPELLTLASTD
ncbi:hypothetical protein Nepgr_031646 [Nepenthes gracilis]|uniref:J domain-containing protein n=1 Tax=Nepenthes gracilis TaxID=150966 RepID=A0AAD3Y5B3_NEPGR|nr:hypothetical protein Nepgr_031646 [Nepenthes gracilis]